MAENSRQPYKRLTRSTLELVHNWTSPETMKRKKTTPKVVYLPECSFMIHDAFAETTQSHSRAKSKKKVVAASVYHPWELRQKRWGQAQRQGVSTQIEGLVREWKKANCFTYFSEVEKCKFRDRVGGSSFLPRKVFPEGFMPPWRIQHESHTCSELSCRILLWNASYVQTHSN